MNFITTFITGRGPCETPLLYELHMFVKLPPEFAKTAFERFKSALKFTESELD